MVADAELMSRTASGDREAFAALVDRHKNRLVNYLTSLTRDRERAEDFAQEAFVRVFESAGRYQERGQFLPYLFRIATNLLRTEERKARRRELLLHTFHRNGNGHAPSPQTELLQEEIGVRVASALARLPLRYRAPLLLREMEGWSYEDIAAALDCRAGDGQVTASSWTRGATTPIGVLLDEWRCTMTLNDNELGSVLRDLPRYEASGEFTNEVMARLERRPPKRPRSRTLVALAAGVVLAAGIWMGVRTYREHEARAQKAVRAEQLRQEYEALQRELRDLRSVAREASPVMELGGTPDVQFIFDLERFANELSTGGAQPISHRMTR